MHFIIHKSECGPPTGALYSLQPTYRELTSRPRFRLLD